MLRASIVLVLLLAAPASAQTMLQVHERLFFKPGSAQIDWRSAPLIAQLESVFRSFPDLMPVEIQGFADSGEHHPALLALHRAEAVRAALVQRGIPAASLIATGIVEPGAGLTSAQRALHMRVIFVVQPVPLYTADCLPHRH